MRLRSLGVLVAVAIPLLGACTPPVPPEVQSFRDELNVPCGTGSLTISRPELYTDFVDNLVSNFTTACPDVSVNVVDPDPTQAVDIAITDQATASGCDVKIDTPIAYDGTAIVFSQSSISELDLSAGSLSALLRNEVAKWSDSRLTKDNPDGEFPSDAITLVPSALPAATTAINDWGKSLDQSHWTAVPDHADAMPWNTNDALTDLSNDNVVGMAPLSFALNNSLSVAAVKDPKFDTYTYADVDSLTAGASQESLADDSSFILSPVWDAAKAPVPPAGSDTASQPWGAVYAVHGLMCANTASAEAAQSFLRYGVRADEQQSVSSYSLAPIPEDVRLKLASKLNQGLHIPTDVPIPN
jgi:ABC-type phosphate transport system substrate-binding protein